MKNLIEILNRYYKIIHIFAFVIKNKPKTANNL